MLVQFKAESLTCNGCYHTDHITIPSNARISLLFRFYFKAESFTWTAPPPAWTPTDANDVRTFKFSVLNGSANVALRWNYSLGTGELVASKSWTMDGVQIALVGLVTRINDDRFAVDSEEVATLIIKDVSEIEDATIQLIVQTTINIWKHKIRVEVTGEKSCKSDTLEE